jgi:mannose-6-phosphate isomerase-like protein (cupin superfamily)
MKNVADVGSIYFIPNVEQDSLMADHDPTQMNAIVSHEWTPQIIRNALGQLVKYIIFQGESVRPAQVEDELFVVLSGQIMLTSGERCIVLNPTEFVLIAKDVEYKVIAYDEVRILCKVCPSTP